jgi:hypothetical protein
MIAAAIIAAEAAFWAFLIGGLLARYALGRPRLGAALLVGVPLVDVALLSVTAIDLAGGARADWSHGLAAIYLGVSVAFGPTLVRAADRRVARRFAAEREAAPAPRAAARGAGPQWRLWLRALAAGAMAAGMLGALVAIGGPADTRALWEGGGWFAQIALVVGIWLLAGPLWATASRLVPRPAATRKEQVR